MAAITRLGPGGYGARRASSFAGKTPSDSGAHPVGVITRPGSGGYGVRRTGSFAGKGASSSTHPVGIITRPCSGGYGARRCGSFADKTVDVPIVVPPTPEVDGGGTGQGGGGGFAYRAPHYARPADRYEVPIVAHAEADEEAIIIAILTRVAQIEYYDNEL